MPYSPSCRTPSRVFVNARRLPVSDIDLHIRREGPLDVTRYCQGAFASPYEGEDYASTFGGIHPSSQNDFDVITIDVLDESTDEYSLAFVGVVTGVGPSADGNERMYQFRARGPGHLLRHIPASRTFSGFTVNYVIEHIASELEDRVPFAIHETFDPAEIIDDPEAVAQGAEDTLENRAVRQLADATDEIGGELAQQIVDRVTEETGLDDRLSQQVEDTVRFETPKSFEPSKHTLADVAQWFANKANTRLWLSPTQDGAAFVGDQSLHHRAHYIDNGNLRVVSNDALSELRPPNSIILRGSANFSLDDPSQYLVIEARHTGLHERAGGRDLYIGTNKMSDAQTKGELENEAKSMLKDHIDQATGGDMTTLLRGPIEPLDTVTAKPTCDQQRTPDREPLTYGVSRVHHQIRASETSTTKLNVGIKTDVEDDIEIVDSWVEEA